MFRIVLLILATTNVVAQSIDWSDPDSVAAAIVAGHPRATALETSARAAKERIVSAGLYPNPMLMAGVENQPVDLTTDGMTMYVVGASQTLPNRQRLRSRTSQAELLARRTELELDIVRAEIRRDALLTYWDLAEADSQVAVLEKTAVATQMLIDAARARYETGTASQSEVIRAQLALTNLQHEILGVRGRREIAAARLSAMSGGAINEVPAIHLPHGTGARELTAPVAVADSHPAVAAALIDVLVAENDIELARTLKRPDISIDAQYGLRPDETDMFSVVARMELPIRRDRTIEPRVRAALTDRDAAKSRAEALRRVIAELLAIDAAVHRQANEEIRLHEEMLIPQSRLAFESALAGYQAGRESFSNVSEAHAALLRIEFDYYGFLARHIKAITDFEAILDGATTRGAVTSATAGAAAAGRSGSDPGMGGM